MSLLDLGDGVLWFILSITLPPNMVGWAWTLFHLTTPISSKPSPNHSDIPCKTKDRCLHVPSWGFGWVGGAVLGDCPWWLPNCPFRLIHHLSHFSFFHFWIITAVVVIFSSSYLLVLQPVPALCRSVVLSPMSFDNSLVLLMLVERLEWKMILWTGLMYMHNKLPTWQLMICVAIWHTDQILNQCHANQFLNRFIIFLKCALFWIFGWYSVFLY